MKSTFTHRQAGSSLIVVISILATLMVIVGVAAEYTYTIQRHVQRSNTMQSAVALADSCIEILFAHWRTTCSSPANAGSPLATSAFSSIPTPAPPQLNLPTVGNFCKRGTIVDPKSDEGPSPSPSDYDPDYTISNYKVVAVDPQWRGLGSSSATPKPMLGQLATAITSGTPSATTPVVYNYVASADVTLPGLGKAGKVVAKLQRVFQKQQISPWSFAIFYVDPLEIHPGPQFTVTGWVHTNSDLYTGHDTLTFGDKVSYASDWFVDFMPGDSTHPETPSAPNTLAGLPPSREQALQPFGLDSTALFNTTDTNPNNDSYHELIEPPTSTPDPLKGMRYWDQAGVIIEVSDSPSANTVRIGTPHINGSGYYDGTIDVLSTSSNMYKLLTASGVITTNQPIQDGREGASVRLVTLDVSKMVNGTGANPNWGNSSTSNVNPFTGAPIIYIYDKSATSSNRRGVRVKGAAKIPVTGSGQGLTIASNNPVYLQGDFNTGIATSGTTVPSNDPANLNSNGTYSDPANPPNPQVSGYTRTACSVLADAVTILSNNWDDSISTASLGSRQATATTVNAAVVSGIVPTNTYSDGGYSGGAENFPRFLEDWSNEPLTYYGSMVELYQSRQSVGEWHYGGNVYNAPAREWYFDNNFKLTPPPGSLMVYSYIKGKWALR